MKQLKQTSRKFSGFLDSGTSFTGDLHFEGTLRVDGVIDGSVATPDALIVGPSAIIRANVRAGSVQVHGHIVGDVFCTQRLELCSEGRIDGDIVTPQLVVEDGGTLDGKSRMTDPSQAVAAELDRMESIAVADSVSSLPEAVDTEPADGTESRRSRWRNFGRHLDAAALGKVSTSPPDAE